MAFTTSVNMTDIVQTAYDRDIYFALRSKPVHDMIADVIPGAQPHPGDVVTLTFFNNLSQATTTLDESTDVSAVVPTDTQVSITIDEYGNAIQTTARLRATSLLDVDAGFADLLAFNMIDSLDVPARNELTAGTNVVYGGNATSRATIDTADTITSAKVREIVAKLRANSALPRRGEFYVALIHPHVSYDLRSEAGSNASWRESHVYAAPEALYAGEIGAYEGAVFVETPRARIFSDAGTPSTVDVYATIFVGQEALAKAVAIEPHLVQSPVTDKLRRFPAIGWYTLLGWKRFREAALFRLESASALGANT